MTPDRRCKVLVAVAAGLALSSCSHLEEGEVTGKNYEAPSAMIVQSCSGQPSVCVPVVVNTGPSWELHLREGDDEGWMEVSPQAFARCDVGERFPECAEGM